jgi:hypothetical protein
VLAVAQSLSRAEVVALLRADQLKRWQRGERVPLEAYLEHLPGLRDSDEVLLDLVSGEVILREALGEPPSWEEYQERFPRHSELLRRLFALHRIGAENDRADDESPATPSPGPRPCRRRPPSWSRSGGRSPRAATTGSPRSAASRTASASRSE